METPAVKVGSRGDYLSMYGGVFAGVEGFWQCNELKTICK
jgi:hypothetical protein